MFPQSFFSDLVSLNFIRRNFLYDCVLCKYQIQCFYWRSLHVLPYFQSTVGSSPMPPASSYTFSPTCTASESAAACTYHVEIDRHAFIADLYTATTIETIAKTAGENYLCFSLSIYSDYILSTRWSATTEKC